MSTGIGPTILSLSDSVTATDELVWWKSTRGGNLAVKLPRTRCHEVKRSKSCSAFQLFFETKKVWI